MKLIKRVLIISIIMLLTILTISNRVYAISVDDVIDTNIEYTEEYKQYLNLTEEEKKNTMMPMVYKMPVTRNIIRNPFILLKTPSISETRFSLKSVIPNNLAIRNQGKTNECWTFTTLSSLETNLALLNGDNKTYDFSERHMDYYTSRTFKNNVINNIGFGREVGDGGNYYVSLAYLTNGSGAIKENDMPFENNEKKIEISNVQNKSVVTQVYDYRVFPTYSASEGNTTEVKNEIKRFVKQYGSLMTMIHGAQLQSDYYNNSTGAIYCDVYQQKNLDHGVSIVGWDDNYAIENFNQSHRPHNKGAWIIRNSWGEKLEYDIQEFKQEYFNNNRSELEAKGITSASMISDEIIINYFRENGFTVSNGKAVLQVGDKGFMYVSYEDAYIYTQICGIEKSANNYDYDNIYQHNFYGYYMGVPIKKSKAYLGEIFDKKDTSTEYLNQVALNVAETCTCKVYVNPNGTSINKNDLQLVQLKAGSSETFDAGYHTLEFSQPVALTGRNFAVVVEMQGTRQNNLMIPLEQRVENTIFEYVTLDEGKSFATVETGFDSNEWIDLSKVSRENNTIIDGDGTIKAFTTKAGNNPVEKKLTKISVSKMPTKTKYIQNSENLNLSGGVILATYNNGTTEQVNMTSTKVQATGFSNKNIGTVTITLTYEGLTTSFNVEIVKNTPTVTPTAIPTAVPSVTPTVTPSTEKKAENSNFENANVIVNLENKYTYTNGKEDYMTIETTITGLNRKTNNDQLEYYYYVSTNVDEKAIEDWAKISETQISKDKITFKIDSRDIADFDKVERAEKVYLYIKEVAVNGNEQKELITNAMLLQTGSATVIKTYVNDIEQKNEKEKDNEENKETNTNSSNIESNITNKETIKANEINRNGPTVLPKTGSNKILVLAIFAIVASSAFMYIRYKKISKYIK